MLLRRRWNARPILCFGYPKEEVSYRELDNQTNRAARHLRSLYTQLLPEQEARAAKLCWSSPLTTSIFALADRTIKLQFAAKMEQGHPDG